MKLKGYFVTEGYMGYVNGEYRLFADETDYREYLEDQSFWEEQRRWQKYILHYRIKRGEKAGIFPFFKGNTRIGSGKKLHFTELHEADEDKALALMDMLRMHREEFRTDRERDKQ